MKKILIILLYIILLSFVSFSKNKDNNFIIDKDSCLAILVGPHDMYFLPGKSWIQIHVHENKQTKFIKYNNFILMSSNNKLDTIIVQGFDSSLVYEDTLLIHNGRNIISIKYPNNLGFIAISILTSSYYNNFKIKDISASKSDNKFDESSINSTEIKDNFKYNLVNYPNPFNYNTIIKYKIKKSGFVNITIYNVLGQKIKTLVNEYKSCGVYSIDFNSSSLSSGIYFNILNINNHFYKNKMVLIR